MKDDISAKAWPRWLALAILLLAFALRVYRLGSQNIWWDEGYSVHVARHSLSALTTLAAADTHPPLYYWILHLWMGAAGQTEFALRFPSVAFGVLAVAVVYRLGRCLINDRRRPTAELVAVLAAMLLAISRFHVWWSQEIRMYSLAALWAAASMLALINFKLHISNSRLGHAWPNLKSAILNFKFVLYALTVMAGLYSLYLFVFVVAAQAMFVVWAVWRKLRSGLARQAWALLAGWGGAMVVALLALLPWLLYTLPRLKSWSAATQFNPLTYLQLCWTVLTLGLTEHVEYYGLANLVFALIIVVGILNFRLQISDYKLQISDSHSSVVILAALALLVPVVGVFILLTLPQGLFYRPPLEARYQLLSVPALALVLAASIAGLWNWRRPIGALAGVAVVGLMLWKLPEYYEGRYVRDDFQTMTRAIAAYAEPGDALVLVSGDRFPLFNFRYDALPERESLPDVTAISVRQVTPADAEQTLAPLAQAHRRVWLAEVEKNLQDPEGLLAAWLDTNRAVVWREDCGYNRLTLYSADNTPPLVADRDGEHELWAEVGDALFWGYDLPVREVRPGDVAHWIGYFKVGAPFTLTISLKDAGGQVLETRDYWLEPQSTLEVARARFDVPIYARTPAGQYHFTLAPLSSQPVDMPLRIAGTQPLETVAFVPNALDAQVGEYVQLEGYQAPAVARPGDTLLVTLYWRAWRKIPQHYTVFVQLVGAEFNPQTNGPLWAGHDSEPFDGGYPTSQWFTGKLVADTHTLTLPPNIPPGEYELWAGMYTLPDVTRLPVYDIANRIKSDHVVLGRVRVE